MGAGWMMDGGWANGMGFGLHGVGSFIVWGLVLWGGFKLLRAFTSQDQSHEAQGKKAALDILKTRLAKGEISQEEYHKLQEVLER